MSAFNTSEMTAENYAVINESTQASNEIVAAVAGKKIRVVSVVLVCSAANVVTWQSAATAISGPMSFAANGGYALASEAPLFETVAGEALNLLSGSAVQVSGHILYGLI